MTFSPTYKSFGAGSVLIEWPSEIKEAILFDILHFKEKIIKNNVNRIIEVRSAYNSLLVVYCTLDISFEEEVAMLKRVYISNEILKKINSRLWKIPVCYDASFGIDLKVISEEKNISVEQLIERHSQVTYLVYFIGFLPGFLYLGGLDETLVTPRKSTPRLKIKKGSVAIGGNQTGIYPIESPGGWNIIGNTPIDFFNPKNNPPCFAKAGDSVQFYPVSLDKYQEIKALVEAQVFQIEGEVVDG